jgi:hypothetical protein
MTKNIAGCLQDFESISLKALDAFKLMNRVDTKYIFNRSQLVDILDKIKYDYKVLEINQQRLFNYESLYFDTPAYNFYFDHHNCRSNRIKVRFRKYVDTGDIFFEIKKRVKGERTDKYRIKTDAIHHELLAEEMNLMQSLSLKEQALENKVWINYKRITLACLSNQERVTIDMDMSFEKGVKLMGFSDLIVAEVKQDRFSRLSSFTNEMRKNIIPDFRISKYAMAVAMMEQGIKNNAFKYKINKLLKVNNGNIRTSK